MRRLALGRALACGLLALAAVVRPLPARAQTNERLFEGLDFRFATPGARAVGMGVTFVGLADDATAAASNPGGLSNLRHVELSVEFLGSESRQSYLVNNDHGDVFRSFGQTSWVLPSFASIAIPVGDGTLAAFVNNQQRFRRSFSLDPRTVPAVSSPVGELPASSQTGESGDLDVSVMNYGVGGAWTATSWLSLGGSLVLSHLNLESEGRNLEGTALRSRTRTSASVVRPSLFAGVLAHPLPRLAVGFGYYRRTTFPMQTALAGTFGNVPGAETPDRCVNESFTRPGRACELLPPLRTDYVVPTRVAVGGSFRLSPQLTAVAELAHVRYSEMVTANFQIIDFRYASSLTADRYSFDNVNEYHGGLEYRRPLGTHILALRAGAFSDPSHSLRFRFSGPSGANAVENFVFNLNASRGTRLGTTWGAGLTFGNHLQADAAVSLLPGANRFVLSFVRRLF